MLLWPLLAIGVLTCCCGAGRRTCGSMAGCSFFPAWHAADVRCFRRNTPATSYWVVSRAFYASPRGLSTFDGPIYAAGQS